MLRLICKITKSFALGYRFASSQQRFQLRNYQFSRQFSSQLNSISELLSQLAQAEKENDKETLLLIHEKLAVAYTISGDINQATIWWENYVKLAESTKGSANSKLERLTISLGEQFRSQGNPQKAIEYYEKALKMIIISYGEQSKEVAETFTHIASCYLMENEIDKAEQALKKASNYMEQQENSGFLAAATFFQYSGIVASIKNEFPKSIENFQKCRKIFENVLGKYAIDVATIDESMANDYCKANRKEEAKPCYQSAISIKERLRYYDLNLYTKLILVLLDLKNTKEINETVEKAVKVIQNAHGKNSVVLAKFYHDLGQKLQAAGDLELSSKFLAKTLEALENIPNQNTEEIAAIYDKISLSLINTKVYEKTIRCLQKALTIKTYLGVPQEALVSSWYFLGIAYLELKDYEKSEGYLLQAKEIFERNSFNKIALAECLNFLAILYRDTKEYASAVDLFKRAIAIKCEVFGQNYTGKSEEYGELGMIYKLWGKTTEALENFYESVEINNKTLGKDNAKNAELFLHIGDINYILEKYDQAIEYYKKSLEIRKKAFGDKDKCIGSGYYFIAHSYKKLKEWDTAEEYYKKGIECDLKNFGDKTVFAGKGYFYLGSMYEDKGDKYSALENYKKAEIFYLNSTSYEPDLTTIQTKIEVLNKLA